MKKTIDFQLILSFFISCFIAGTVAAGYSGHLIEDVQANVTNGKVLIKEWTVESPYGFYKNLVYENGHFIFPKEGIYLLSANVLIESKQSNFAEVSFNEGNSRICRSFDHILDKTTITISCFARLKKLTRLGLRIFNKRPLTIYRGSSLSVQYMGTVGDTPSFIQPISDFADSNVSHSTDSDDYSYFNSFTVADNLSRFTVYCAGIYLISISANGMVDEKSKIELIINNDTVIAFNSFSMKKRKSMTFLSSFFLNKGDLIELRIEQLVVLEQSTYSILLMNNDVRTGFSIPLSVTDEHNDVCKLIIHQGNIASMSPFYFNYNHDNNADSGMEILMDNLYLISLRMKYKSQDEQVRIVISNDEHSSLDDMHVSGGLASIDTSSTENAFRSTSIVGVLRIRRSVRLNIEIKSCTRFTLSEAFVTLVPVLQKTYASSASMKDLDGEIKYCKDSWIVLDNFLTNKKFLLSKYMTKKEFNIPNDGLYFVYAEINLKASMGNFQKVTLAFQKETSNQYELVLKNTKSISSSQNKMFIGSHLDLRRGEKLQLLLTCGGAVRIIGRIEFKIIYSAPLFTPQYIISALKHSDTFPGKTWTRKLSPTIQEAGVYFVTYIITLKIPIPTSVKLYIYTSDETKERGLSEEYAFNKNSIIADDTITLETIGHLKLKQKEKINVEVSLAALEAADKYIAEDRLTLSLATHAAGSIYGFKTRQRAQKLFDFHNNKLTRIDNFAFAEETGGFLLTSTSFFGPYFVAFKPVTIFYHVAVSLKDVKGLFKLCVRIRPRNTLIDISTAHEVEKTSSITLSAVGILNLAIEESVQLLVYGTNIQTLVLCTGSIWSVVEISTPISQLYRHYPEVDWGDELLENYQTYAVITNENDYTHKQRNFKLVPYDNSTNEIKNLLDQKSDLLFLNKPFMKNVNQQKHSNNSNHYEVPGTCFVYLIISPFPFAFKGANEIFFRYNKIQRVQTYQVLCLNNTDLMSTNSDHVNLNISHISFNISTDVQVSGDETLELLKLQNLEQTEGFASILSREVIVMNEEKRLDGWNTNDNPFFDQTFGIGDGTGLFVSQKNGNYIILVNLVVENLEHSKNRCHIRCRKNDFFIHSVLINASTISLSYIVWLQKNDVLQILVKCNGSQISVTKNTTWAVLLLDSSPSFQSTCGEQLDQIILTPFKSEILLPARSKFTLTCSLKSKQYADYLWLKNNLTVVKDFGRRGSSIQIDSVGFNDSGSYECIMTRGKFKQRSKLVAIDVFEPRPTLVLSNDTVFIQENYVASKLLAWVHVSAIDSQGKTGAAVELSILQGNEDNNFYFEPQITNTVASLYFRRPFDYEYRKTYKLLLQAQNVQDKLTASLTTKYFSVKVINKNEYKPRFREDVKTCYVMENSLLNTRICKINAIDKDGDAMLTYMIFYTSFENVLSIRSDTGELYVNASIDREVVDVISVLVTVSDGTYSAFQHVKLIVQDLNDNRPQYEQQVLEKSILVNNIDLGLILKVTASDPDQGENGKIIYKLLNASHLFFLNKSSGEMFVKRHPDILALHGRYEFQIEARDSGLPSLAQNCTIILNFLFGNETMSVKTIVKPLHDQMLNGIREWRYWIIGGTLLLLIFLLVLLLVCYSRYKRSRKQVEQLLNRKSEEETFKSLLKCSLKETESAEITMYISSESLPSAYQSQKDLKSSKDNLHLKIYESQLCINGTVDSSSQL